MRRSLRDDSATSPTAEPSTYTSPQWTAPAILATPSNEVDDDAVLSKDHSVRGDAGPDGQLAFARRWRYSPCTGMTLRGLHDVVAVRQLAGGGVTADVDESVALVDDVGAEPGEPVDDATDRVLVARG